MAVDLTIIGPQITLEYNKPRYSPNEGLFWEQRWAGTRNEIDAQVALLNLDSDETFEYDESASPMWRITIRTPDMRGGLGATLNKWEVVHNKSEISLKEHAKFKALPVDQASAIAKYIKNATVLAFDGAYFTSDDAAIAYNMLLKGSNKTLDFERVFRYSVLTSARWASLLTEANIGRLYSTASLLDPAISGLIIPSATAAKLSAVQLWANANRPTVTEAIPRFDGDPLDFTFTTYVYSWLKQPADTEQLPSGKLRHTQEFWGYRWSTWEYGTVL